MFFCVLLQTETNDSMAIELELLSPAKNLEQGMAAINHGADAVYIGAPSFGARQAAGNSIEDIEELVKYAHLYGSKVFATVNTLLFDEELQAAEEMMWKLYNAGVDAAIVQDMGLLETHLPPIELHASTQTHNYDPRRIKFLEQIGFKRIILARETSLEQMRNLRADVTADLEAFVQGALCVCFSGQCYMSQYLTGRSGNRGACSQPCRSSYNLLNASGKELIHDAHLLSLKDFSAVQHIESMIDAGITSFKIEGRLKDLSYVKNVTTYYRKLLDNIIARREGLKSAGSGKTTFFFEPDLQRTFNRGFTDYFLVGRHLMASHATQKSIGKKIGTVVSCTGNTLKAKLIEPLHAGDGICYLSQRHSRQSLHPTGTERTTMQLEGFLVNRVDSLPSGTRADRRVEGDKIIANKQLEIKPSTILWRNNDYIFEKQLQGVTSERKITVSMTLTSTEDRLKLTINDEDGCIATVESTIATEPAREQAKMRETVVSQLKKLGGTPFAAENIEIYPKSDDALPFIPSSIVNQMRRDAVEELIKQRQKHFKPADIFFPNNDIPYFEDVIDPRANVVNHKAEEFYRHHGVMEIKWGIDTLGSDLKKKKIDIPLMTTKYCLRYELGQCLKNNCTDPDYRGELFLENNGKRFRLIFDCKKCQMQVMLSE